MENDLKTESLQESLNKKSMNKSISITSKEEEIKNVKKFANVEKKQLKKYELLLNINKITNMTLKLT